MLASNVVKSVVPSAALIIPAASVKSPVVNPVALTPKLVVPPVLSVYVNTVSSNVSAALFVVNAISAVPGLLSWSYVYKPYPAAVL